MIKNKKLLITGANGFIGKNLILKLREMKFNNLLFFYKGDSLNLLKKYIKDSDFIIHLAGINRNEDPNEFTKANVELTSFICKEVKKVKYQEGKNIPVIFSSSTKVKENSTYGETKLMAEKIIKKELKNYPFYIIRLPGVFGKWCKPNYNSVVATFCYNISREKKIIIEDPDKELNLVHIDDVVSKIIYIIENSPNKSQIKVSPENKINVKDLATILNKFYQDRKNFLIPDAGKGFNRALYSTFISYLPESKFGYKINIKEDKRGKFCELLKGNDNGQISFLTINPGFKRGGHYHNTKTEKFIVLKGKVKFFFSNLLDTKTIDIYSSYENPEIVDSIPGWFHELENIGNEEALVLLWANEIYDVKNHDTYYPENN